MSELLALTPEDFAQALHSRLGQFESIDPLAYIYQKYLQPRLQELHQVKGEVVFVLGPLSPKPGMSFEDNWDRLNSFTEAVRRANPDIAVFSTTKVFSIEDEIRIREFYGTDIDAHDAFSTLWEKMVLPSGFVTHIVVMPNGEALSSGVRREVTEATALGLTILRPLSETNIPTIS